MNPIVTQGNSSNTRNGNGGISTSTNKKILTPAEIKIKNARIEKLIEEGRFSEAEAIAAELKDAN